MRPNRLASDSTALFLSTAATAGLGAVFWVAATRLYPVEAVGQATGMVNVGTVLASFANLSLGPLFERFLPPAGYLQAKAVAMGLAVSAALSILFGAAFVLFGPTDELFHGGTQAAAFVLSVAVLAAFALLDSILVGVGEPRWVAAKNVAHAVAKLFAIVITSSAATGFSILLGWILPAVVAVGTIELLLFGGRRFAASHEPARLPPQRELLGFAGASFGWMLGQAIPGLMIPVLVLDIAGVEQMAYFNIAWTVVTTLLLVVSLTVAPFVSAASQPGADLPALTRSFLRIVLAVSLLSGVAVGLAGPLALMLYGGQYAEEGTPLLLIMGAVFMISGVTHLYGALARVYRRIVYPMTVQTLGAIVQVSLVAWWLEPMGIKAVAAASMVQTLFVIALVTPPLVGMLRATFAAPPAPVQRPEPNVRRVGGMRPG